MSYYNQTELSTQSISELICMHKFANDAKTAEMAESAIIKKMEYESLRNNNMSVEIVLGTEGLSNRIMFKALELNSGQIDFVSNALVVIYKDNNNEVKKMALDILAKRAFLHTLEEIRKKRIFKKNKVLTVALAEAIKKCITVCTHEGHTATLARRRIRKAACG